jgi:hypothetical protein
MEDNRGKEKWGDVSSLILWGLMRRAGRHEITCSFVVVGAAHDLYKKN